jgi:hypothetical protein
MISLNWKRFQSALFTKEIEMNEAVWDANDAAMNTAKAKFQAAYGTGFSAIPWQTIITALLSILSGCTPTPASIRTGVDRPMMRARMRLRLWRMGVPNSQIDRAIEAAAAAVKSATDEEVSALIEASSSMSAD